MSKDFDAIRTDQPFTTLDGTETFVLQSGGVTKGGFMSVLRDWVRTGFQIASAAITDASASGKTVLTGTPAEGRGALQAQAALTTVSDAEVAAGTGTTVRGYTPAKVTASIKVITDPLQTTINALKPKPSSELTADKTVDAPMLFRMNTVNSATAVTITLPKTGTAFDTASTLTILNVAAGTVTVKSATGATMVGKSITGNTTTLAQYDSLKIQCIGTDAWFVEK